MYNRRKKYCEATPSEIKMVESIKATFKNKDFKVFVFSDLVYWIAITTFQNALLYYITILLDLPEAMLSILLILLGVGSFIFYVPVNLLAKIWEEKTSYLCLCSFYSYLLIGFLLGKLPISNTIQAYLLVIFASIPMAVFGILPNAVIADIAEFDAIHTGSKREAIFFGTRTFMSKVGQMLSMLVLSSLLLYKRNGSNEIGIRLTALSAALFCFLGLILFLKYNEQYILIGISKRIKI
ncbi:MFS transporter [Caloramator sp. Dgby_cultured_2]|nr:MFS transporter [Caloramator sp. Dgby_cultured_2]WDU84691.1 MFS transporter [Caloramator sp. Dgby_cultured_2]